MEIFGNNISTFLTFWIFCFLFWNSGLQRRSTFFFFFSLIHLQLLFTIYNLPIYQTKYISFNKYRLDTHVFMNLHIKIISIHFCRTFFCTLHHKQCFPRACRFLLVIHLFLLLFYLLYSFQNVSDLCGRSFLKMQRSAKLYIDSFLSLFIHLSGFEIYCKKIYLMLFNVD